MEADRASKIVNAMRMHVDFNCSCHACGGTSAPMLVELIRLAEREARQEALQKADSGHSVGRAAKWKRTALELAATRDRLIQDVVRHNQAMRDCRCGLIQPVWKKTLATDTRRYLHNARSVNQIAFYVVGVLFLLSFLLTGRLTIGGSTIYTGPAFSETK